MMKNKIAIVIPQHRATLKWNEDISLRRCKEVFSNYDVILAYPKGIDISEYKKYNVISKYVPLKPEYFSNEAEYNRLMNTPYFYRHFLEYDYILIYQLDTFVFENNLEHWCNMNIDYVGAPWINSTWVNNLKKKITWIDKFIYPVGNGGLSLRKVRTFYYGSIYLYPLALFWKGSWHEDFFWSSVAHRLIPFFKIPDTATALKFAFEEHPSNAYDLNNHELPFGCHAWEKFDTEFWRPHLKKYGYEF
jgi:hypothetical protein